MKNLLRQSWAGLRLLVVFTVILGVVYPAAVWGVGQVGLRSQAGGSILTRDGQGYGSALLGQDFPGEQWFHTRPSASGYGGDTSAPSNLGPNSADLVAQIQQRRAQIAAEEGVDPASVPADALTASGSGLDPHISPAYAALQVARVARVNNLDEAQVRAAVAQATRGRDLGFLGEERVNVVQLNAMIATLGS